LNSNQGFGRAAAVIRADGARGTGMEVVANAGLFMVLGKLGLIHLLYQLYGRSRYDH
jgi:hypothetical protein